MAAAAARAEEVVVEAAASYAGGPGVRGGVRVRVSRWLQVGLEASFHDGVDRTVDVMVEDEGYDRIYETYATQSLDAAATLVLAAAGPGMRFYSVTSLGVHLPRIDGEIWYFQDGEEVSSVPFDDWHVHAAVGLGGGVQVPLGSSPIALAAEGRMHIYLGREGSGRLALSAAVQYRF